MVPSSRGVPDTAFGPSGSQGKVPAPVDNTNTAESASDLIVDRNGNIVVAGKPKHRCGKAMSASCIFSPQSSL